MKYVQGNSNGNNDIVDGNQGSDINYIEEDNINEYRNNEDTIDANRKVRNVSNEIQNKNSSSNIEITAEENRGGNCVPKRNNEDDDRIVTWSGRASYLCDCKKYFPEAKYLQQETRRQVVS